MAPLKSKILWTSIDISQKSISQTYRLQIIISLSLSSILYIAISIIRRRTRQDYITRNYSCNSSSQTLSKSITWLKPTLLAIMDITFVLLSSWTGSTNSQILSPTITMAISHSWPKPHSKEGQNCQTFFGIYITKIHRWSTMYHQLTESSKTYFLKSIYIPRERLSRQLSLFLRQRWKLELKKPWNNWIISMREK